MWERKQLKKISKERFKLNYWKCVLISFILVLASAGMSSAGSASSSASTVSRSTMGGMDSSTNGSINYDDSNKEYFEGNYEGDLEKLSPEDILNDENTVTTTTANVTATVIFIIVFIIVFLFIFAIAMAFWVFVINPGIIGCYRFFHKNLTENAQLKEICYTFDGSYKNPVKIMFFMDLYTMLWTLLLIIPGIVKSYEYRMIPYILGDNPDMSMTDVFALSKKMMTGNKWKAFVLDLSFIPWHLLSGITLGIVGLFYVNPYLYQTNAALYDALKETNQVAMEAAQ